MAKRWRDRLVRKNLTYNFRMLYFARITINSATQLMGLFLPIFLYQFLDFSLSLVIVYYLIIDLLYLGLVVYGCRGIMNRWGIKKTLQISILFGAIYYSFFFLINHYLLAGDFTALGSKIWWLVPTIFLSLFFRLTHWIPFHTSLATLTDRSIRASQLSFLEATILALGAVMPLVAGLALEYLGYSWLFLLAVIIYLISWLPFSRLPQVKEKFSWSYGETWRRLFSKKNKDNFLAYAGSGAESVVGSVVWPIFIWELLSGNYLGVGAISSVIIIFTIILQMVAGYFLDRQTNRRRWLRYGTWLYSLGWVLKALVNSALQVFLFSTYHNLSRVFAKTPFDALNYDIAADHGHYVDEYTVTREMAIAIGKAIMSVLILVIIPFMSLRWVFVVAALASLFMFLLNVEEIYSD